jgi:hypothetical protein
MDTGREDLPPSISERLRDRKKIEAGMRESIVNAMRIHKFFRVPWVTWQDGKVVEIPPEETPVNEADFDYPPTMPIW